jgi:hypothetical protein
MSIVLAGEARRLGRLPLFTGQLRERLDGLRRPHRQEIGPHLPAINRNPDAIGGQ